MLGIGCKLPHLLLGCLHYLQDDGTLDARRYEADLATEYGITGTACCALLHHTGVALSSLTHSHTRGHTHPTEYERQDHVCVTGTTVVLPSRPCLLSPALTRPSYTHVHAHPTHTDAAWSSANCDGNTRLALRGEDLSGTGGNVDAWPPVCGCGTGAIPTPSAPATPPAYVDGTTDGPNGKPYMNCHVDDSLVARDLAFDPDERSTFEFDDNSDGFIVTAVVRMRATAKAATATMLFNVM